MKRDTGKFQEKQFDLLVVGGGINGAWITLDAVQRGMSVAMIDKGDFGAATSAATGRIIHGGIRYIQHLAFGRLKKSLHERMLYLRNAPHLVHPLQFLIPTYGHLLQGKEVLSAAMHLYDLFASKEVPGAPYASLPGHDRLSFQDTIRHEPQLSRSGLTGAVRFYDCQMPFPERLTLAVVQSAESSGAVVANYVQARKLLCRGRLIQGAQVQDIIGNTTFDIRAKCVINAAGPWANELLKIAGEYDEQHVPIRSFSKGIHLLTRSVTNGHGLALATRHKHSGSWLDRGGRHFFIVPWEGLSLIGTTNVPFDGAPDQLRVSEDDIQGLIADVNSVYPDAGLCRKDVRYSYAGLYPDDPGDSRGYQGARKDRIIDHETEKKLQGLITVTGVKYTTARKLAEEVVDKAVIKLKFNGPGCQTENTVLYGGDMPGLSNFLQQIQIEYSGKVETKSLDNLVRLLGTKSRTVLESITARINGQKIQEQELLQAQIQHAVQSEMACTLADVIFRRTALGLFGHPGETMLREVAATMSIETGWNKDEIEQEVAQAESHYQPS